MSHLSTEKNAQPESCELSFLWGTRRTIAWETASQIALRTCSEEVTGKVSIIYDFSEGGVVHAVKHTCWQRLAASREEQMYPLTISVLF